MGESSDLQDQRKRSPAWRLVLVVAVAVVVGTGRIALGGHGHQAHHHGPVSRQRQQTAELICGSLLVFFAGFFYRFSQHPPRQRFGGPPPPARVYTALTLLSLVSGLVLVGVGIARAV